MASELIRVWDILESTTGQKWNLVGKEFWCNHHRVAYTRSGWVYLYGGIRRPLVTEADVLFILRNMEEPN